MFRSHIHNTLLSIRAKRKTSIHFDKHLGMQKRGVFEHACYDKQKKRNTRLFSMQAGMRKIQIKILNKLFSCSGKFIYFLQKKIHLC